MKMIACVDKKTLAIGNEGKLLFHCKEDMDFFKKKTLGKIVVMGVKTYDSIGGALKGRLNIVITSHPQKYKTSCDDAIFLYLWQAYKLLASMRDCDNVYIIGGESIYNAFIDFCDEVYLTEVNRPSSIPLKYDTKFPDQIKDTYKWKREGRSIKSGTFPYEYQNSKGDKLSKSIWFRIYSYKRIKND